jgi:hypothetical protein
MNEAVEQNKKYEDVIRDLRREIAFKSVNKKVPLLIIK